MRTIHAFMSSFVFLLIFISLSPISYAQPYRISIAGVPERIPSETVSVRDGNMAFCAAVQVVSDHTGFSYSSYNGIVRVDKKQGMDILYLSADERVIEVFLEGYDPMMIILSDIGIDLEEKEAWKIRLTGDKPVKFFVITDPLDAMIFLDGMELGTAGEYEISIGRHVLEISRDGYKTVKEEVTVSENNFLFQYRLEEVGPVGVQIRSYPSGAIVYLNHVEENFTDCDLLLFPGTYELKLAKEGYLNIEKAITVTETGDNLFFYDLIKNLGHLTLSVAPTDAVVMINGKTYSSKTLELTPGMYKIEISKSGYLPVSDTVEIELGRDIEKGYTLTRNTGILDLTINPSDSMVLINEKDYSGRKVIELVPAQYQLKVFKRGYDQHEEKVIIGQGMTLTREIKLNQQTGTLLFIIKPAAAIAQLVQDGDILESWSGMKPFRSLPVGEYKLICTADGYKSHEQGIVVAENKTDYITVILKEDSVTPHSISNSLGMEFVYIEPGSFMMGSPYSEDGRNSDEIQHRVILTKGFYMQTVEVTQGQWRLVMGTNPSDFKSGDKYPVEKVSWDDVQNFITRLNAKGQGTYRLPTEAEWEYACRAGSSTRFCFGDSDNQLGDYAWYNSNSGNKTHPVALKKANAWGLHDMHGNVWELCSDLYEDYSTGSVTDPENTGESSGRENWSGIKQVWDLLKGEGSNRVLRGGSWDIEPASCRSAHRDRYAPTFRYFYVGFRLVYSPL